MDETTERVAHLFAVQATVVAAAVHLWWGFPRLLVYLRLGSVTDPRPYLFVPSALLLLGVATALVRGSGTRRLHSLGAGVLATYLVGYVWWHLTGHGGLAPSHAGNPVREVAVHLLADPLAFVAWLAQLSGILAFAVLFLAAGDEGESEPTGAATEGDSSPAPDGGDA